MEVFMLSRSGMHDVRSVGFNRSLRQAFHGLIHDPQRLAHFLDARQVTPVHIAFRAGRDLEIKLLVTRIGLLLADVPIDAGAAQ